VKVVDTTPVSAEVKPCEFDGREAVPAEKFPEKSRCELVYAAVDLKLAVDVGPLEPKHRDEAELAETRATIDRIAAKQGSLFRLAKDGENAEVYALVGDGGIYLRRPHDVTGRVTAAGAEVVAKTNETAPLLFGPIPLEAGGQDRLDKSLTTMARAINLRKLVGASEGVHAGDPLDSKVDLKVVVKKWNPATQSFEEEFNPSTLKLYDRDKVRIEVSNMGAVPVDITILYVESAYRIISYLPTLRDAMSGYYSNRVEPDGNPKVAQFTINDSTVGTEDVVVIGVVGDPSLPPLNFAFLEQEGLEQARASEERTRGPGNSPFKTALGELVATAMYGDGTRGGNTQSEMSEFAVRRISWVVSKPDTTDAN
jgi:hypothetical protein